MTSKTSLPNSSQRKIGTLTFASALASCLLFGACFAFPTLSWLAWIALAPLGVVLSRKIMTREAWSGVYLSGLLAHLLALDWIRTLYGGTYFQGHYLPAWIIASQCGALFFCLAVVLGRRCVLSAKLPMTLALPLAWLSSEFLFTQIASLLGQPGLRTLSLAVTQAKHITLAQIVDLGGETILTLLVVVVNGCLFDLARMAWSQFDETAESRSNHAKGWMWFTQLAFVPACLLLVLCYGQHRLDYGSRANDTIYKLGPSVCLMGMRDTPPLMDEHRLERAGQALQPVDAQQPVLLVWPELTYHHALLDSNGETQAINSLKDAWPLAEGDPTAYDAKIRGYLETVARDMQAGMLVGCQRLEATANGVRRHNSLAFADPMRGLVGTYDKRHLAPFSESTPESSSWFANTSRRQYTVGAAIEPFTLSATEDRPCYRFGCAICYDIAFAEDFRTQVALGPLDFFVLSGSEGADATGRMSHMLLSMAKLRAIETRRPIVRHALYGTSGVIEANGRVLHGRTSEQTDAPRVLGVFPLDARVSLYSQWGDWLSPSCLAILIIIFLAKVPWVAALGTSLLKGLADALQQQSLGRKSRLQRDGFSLLELLAVVTILGTLAAVIVPRVGMSAHLAKQKVDQANRGQINAAVESWQINKGTWPADDLSDIGNDPEYFPDGRPREPFYNTFYTLNSTTHRVNIPFGGEGWTK